MAGAVKVGLTGSFGSGKSTVATMLAAPGARVIDADQLAREAVEVGSEGLPRVVEEFGDGAIRADGSLDRAWLAGRVFGDAEALERLNAIVHPIVRGRELALIAQYESEGAELIVLDVPLLFEAGGDEMVDKTIVVIVGEEERVARLQRDRGVTPEEVERRLKTQMPQEEKASRADYVIDNNGDPEETRRQVERVYGELMR